MKKCSTLQFMTNIGFAPSICIHRPIISIFIEKKVCLLIFLGGWEGGGGPRKKYFSAIFDFRFRENPRFRDKFQALLDKKNSLPLPYYKVVRTEPTVTIPMPVTLLMAYAIRLWSFAKSQADTEAFIFFTVPHAKLYRSSYW